MAQKLLLSIVLFAMGQAVLAQISAKVIDGKTMEVLPYANIVFDNSQSRVSNEEGFFSIPETRNGDDTKIMVSFFGYMTRELTLGELRSSGLTVKLNPAMIELQEVHTSIKDPAAIMASVKKNLKKNHASLQKIRKDKIFLRTSTSFIPKNVDIEITESSGFSKKALQEANREIAQFTTQMTGKAPREFTDMLFDYYSGPVQKDQKQVYLGKMQMTKATKLVDEKRSTSLDDLSKKSTDMFLKHLDTTKYYRIKSGWIGSRDTLSLRKDFVGRKRKNKVENPEINSAKGKLSGFLNQNNIVSSEYLSFASNPEIYTYTYVGATYLNDDDFAYIIDFKPRKKAAKYSGRLYISESDFAVLRADYNLAEGKKLDGVNLKLLLGVKFSENLSRGTLIFKRNTIADGYMLQYGSHESGQYFYVNRPIKFIELTDGEKDVVEFELKLEGNTNERSEYLNMSREESSEAELQAVAEKNFTFQRLNQYDASVWKDHAGIEPIQEMKRFKLEDGGVTQ